MFQNFNNINYNKLETLSSYMIDERLKKVCMTGREKLYDNANAY